MSSPRITAFLIDADNEEKFAQHGLSARQVVQVLDGAHLVVRNRKRRRARYLIIGRDNGGQCIAIPVAPTYEPNNVGPVTAWRCKEEERNRLERERI